MKNKYYLAGFIVILGIAIVVFFNNSSNAEIAPQESLGVPVQIEKVIQGRIREENTYVGTVKSKNQIFLTFKQAGFITKLTVQEGDSFQKGELLVQLDAEDLLLKREQAQKKLETARLNTEHLQDLLEKNTILFETGAIPKQKIDELTLNYNLAVNTLEEVELSIKELDLMVDRGNIYAPYDGVVREIMKKEGEFTQPGQPILDVSGKDDLILEIAVIEKDLAGIEIGEKALVYLRDNEVWESQVTAISNTLHPQTKTATIEIPISNESNLLPNMSLKGAIIKEEKETALLIPMKAVFNKAGKDYVYSYENESAQLKEVKLGISNDNLIEVISGLERDDQVIVSNLEELSNQSKVFVFKGVE